MSRIKNISIIKTYGDEGNTISELKVESHWTRSDLVELIVDDKSFCVCGKALKRAIDLCENVNV